MTKKDFEAIAKAIASARKDTLESMEEGYIEMSNADLQRVFRRVEENMIHFLKTKNPAFDRDRFIEACKKV